MKKTILYVTLIIISMAGCLDGGNPGAAGSPSQPGASPQDSAGMSPEEALEAMDGGGGAPQDFSVTIESPRDANLKVGHTRHFLANLTETPRMASCQCLWSFYYTHEGEEELKRTQSSGCLPDKCHWTSAPYHEGILRLRVEMVSKKFTENETKILAFDERKYNVTK